MRQSFPHARGYLVVLIISLLLSLALFVPVPRAVKAQQGGTRQLTQEETEKQNGRRVALVIGNGAYTNAPRLKNPVNDATDIADALSKLGFNVDHGVDLNQKQMKFMIREFAKKLKAGGQGLFYFSGHGVQLHGRNYLIPVDADITSETDVEDQGVDVNLVLGLMDEANNGLNVVILDACRNNPFARSFRSTSSGLAQVDAPTGTLIAYSTAPGRVARDGEGRNGTYTAELLKQMRVPGLTIEELLKHVRASLKQQTNGEQVPWESSSLIGDFYLNRAVVISNTTNKASGPTNTPATSSVIVEQELWGSIKNSTDAEDFRDYLKEYPTGAHAVIARSNLRRLETASKASDKELNNVAGQPANSSEIKPSTDQFSETEDALLLAARKKHNVYIKYKETKLKNGLRVLTVEDHSSPVVAIDITYNVGSRDERPGRTGFAHLFEHMMFKGSENVGTGEHFYLIFNNGGTMNGTTNEDRTTYFEALPSNQLDLALYLEADRMRSLAINQKNLDNQRNAVQEERRLGVDNQPYGKSNEIQQGLIYENFAYKHTTIGSMEDLNAATVEDVAAFFKMYYAPNNAVLVLVGDFNTADALKKIKQNFEAIPRQPDPPPVDMTEPQQTAEHRQSVDDALARAPQVDIAFKAVPGNTPDFYALQVLAASLAGGQSSRLYQALVKDKQLVTNIFGFQDEKRGPGAFYISANLRPGVKTEDVESAIYAEIERLKKDGIADWELEKAKNTTRRNFINGLQSSLSRAIQMSVWTVYYNDPNLINTRMDKVAAITKDDVARVANKYLVQTNRTVVVTIPKRPTAASAK